MNRENKNKEQTADTATISETKQTEVGKQQLSDSKINSEEPDVHSGRILSIKDIVKSNPGRIIIGRPDTGNQSKSRSIKPYK